MNGFPAHVPVLVVGGGACGLTAALAAHDAGAAALVLERDAVPSGSTAMSSGFIPAAGTRWQRSARVVDSPEAMAADITRKNAGEADPRIVATVCAAAAPTLEWPADAHGISFALVEGFLYPGHSVPRMHAVPERTGAALTGLPSALRAAEQFAPWGGPAALMGSLLSACARAGVDIVTSARVTDVIATGEGRVTGVRLERGDGSVEDVGCDALILACSGFGANRALVRRHIPEMADAPYFGHAGNDGDALRWGERLGAAVADLSACQGHGSLATPHNILLTWALMMEGGVQVNTLGARFSNEHAGYSEQSLAALAQPGAIAWCVFDARLHRLGLQFADYREACAAGAIREGADAVALARTCALPPAPFAATLAEVSRYARGLARDPFGRDFAAAPALEPPLFAAKVTGALFHTQGGLVVDATARVLRPDGTPLPNVLAGGGAARGVSGAHVHGYLSGNGLLTAITLGRIAGTTAAAIPPC